jgi:hypothetical protein
MEDLKTEDFIEIDPEFKKFRLRFFDKIPEEELTEDEQALYKVFWAGAIFMQQYMITMTAFKLDYEEGKKAYLKTFGEEWTELKLDSSEAKEEL